MRLKKLEIKGFKSFARNTVINFSENVTGIVGPNGSGKSNIVDSIRWVLGEQKTSDLRLEKMGDVIFNGTKKKKASNMASVAITFVNDDGLLPTEYHEVTVTRNLLRNGHSEYRLNNVVCRLKDIHNLLVDTGIASHSYAIIELGMVDEILSDKDQSRRRMFEQAAGISRYKQRKKDTQRKLKATNEDLERVEDLLHEIRANLKMLEKQARKAKRYLKLKESYKHLSIQLSIHQLESYKEEHSNLQTKIATLQDEYHKLSAEIHTLEAELSSFKEAQLGKEEKLSSLQKEVNSLLNDLRNLENNINLAQRESELASEAIERDERKNREDEEKKAKWEVRLQDLEIRQQEAEMAYESSSKDINNLAEDKSTVEDSHSELSDTHKQMLNEQIRMEKEIFRMEKEFALLENDKSNAQNEIEVIEIETEEFEEQCKNLISQIDEKKKELDVHQTGFEILISNKEKQDQARADLENEKEEWKAKLAKSGRQLDALRNEYNLTKSMVDNLEGFPESIKFLSKNKQWSENAVLFSDLIYCPNEYRPGIESFLEPFLNYYVVRTYAEAFNGISQLRESQKGKAHFFVLEALVSETETKDKSGLLKAESVIEFDQTYAKLFKSLLHNVYISEHEDINLLDREKNISVIAKDGHFLRTGSRISGGSIGLFDGKKMGRKINLENLKKAIDKKEKELARIADEEMKLSEQILMLKESQDEEHIEITRKKINGLRIQSAALESQLESLEKRMQEGKNRIELLLRKVAEFDENAMVKQEALDRQTEMEEKVRNAIQGKSDELEEISKKLFEASKSFNSRQLETLQLKNAVEAVKQERKYLIDQYQLIDKSLDERTMLILKNRKSIEENAQRIEEWKAKEKGLYEKKAQLEGELSDSEQTYFSARHEIQKKEKEINTLNHNQRQVQSLINQQKDKFNDVRIAMNSVGQRVNVEFNVSVEELTKMERDPEVELDGLEEKVEKMRGRLFNFGEVNPLAVEAFNEMEVRHDGIVEQRDDILEAQKSLEETIAELEANASEKFLDAFSRVRANFIDIFQHLFKEGDQCDLILIDEENPLDSSIEIIAKPKGKRPISLSQLSGGEKTLTATALLFALYLLKPAPFCVFDEVDAPLDDVNIQKFNRIIKKFAKDSQFVIITHNKLTMAAVDVIYGIYMDEPGISAVTPVDLRSFHHETLPLELVEN